MQLSYGSILVVLSSVIGLVQAISAVGDRVLVVLEDSSEKALYSQFWSDLECKSTPWDVWRLGEPSADFDSVQHETSNCLSNHQRARL